MTSLQTEFTPAELLADADIAEPLFANGTRCHGGFDGDGRYVSPRTRFRVPAIQAWQERHRQEFGTELLEVPLDTWPDHYPTLAQARLLIERGVREPLVATLTRIGTVEGFGANIRHLAPRDLQSRFDESITGTALAHLGSGLFEAHGRDEAGWEDAAGHRDMWFAARDIAFEGATAAVDVDAMLTRMGFGPARAGAPDPWQRVLPADIDAGLEFMTALMIRVLLIEVQAFHTFAWAEAWLGDRNLVAGDGAAATLVSYIRADEAPHVGYLSTALTELRDRTWIGESGRRYPGTELVGRLWDRGLAQSLGAGRRQNVAALLGEVEHWARRRPDGEDILEQFHALRDERDAAG